MSGMEAVTALATIQRHRDCVRLNIQRLVHELERRAVAHDLSKLSPEELSGFVEINAIAREHPYGSPEYTSSMERAKADGGCIALHYGRNSHHPEFHAHTADMGFLDIVEMVADWKAASDTYGKMTLAESLPIHRERFNFTDAQWWLIEQVAGWLSETEGGEG